jgi:single stranded DNA-binding protein
MAFVRVEQRNAHLAGAVRLMSVEGRDGPISKATLTAISNTRRGGRGEGDNRGEESTAIQWTLWGKQAENAAQYLGKGSHVNVVGRVQNNNYEKDGETVYTMAFTAEEIDYLDTKAEGEAIRAKQGGAPDDAAPVTAGKPAARASSSRPARSRKAAKAPAAEETDDIPL